MTYPKGSDATGVPASPRFPEIETGVLAFWKRDDTFAESIRAREGCDEWVFYDGPPFANGLPHYGHLLTGYAKDVFPRYQTMRGKQVHRRFGWDTHGLPAELEAMRQLGLTEKHEIDDMGIDVFNAAARKPAAATGFDFGFALGPRLNAAGRLADMTLGIECLTTDDALRADELARTLDGINRERKAIEGDMREQAALEHLEARDALSAERAFFVCWTRKEACLKALGLGLQLATDGFEVGVDALAGEPRELDIETLEGVERLRLQSFTCGPDGVGALALRLPRDPSLSDSACDDGARAPKNDLA